MRMIVGVLIGLVAGTIVHSYQNPDILRKALGNLIGYSGLGVVLLKEVPESFASIEATSTPKPDDQAAGETTTVKRSDARVLELEQEVHKGINFARFENGISHQLRWDDNFAEVARAHSEDMVKRGYFAHDTPEGLGPTERLAKSGYSCTKRSHYGLAENLAIQPDLRSIDKIAKGAVESWMNSIGHRTNLLGSQYHRTGIGAAFGRWKGQKSVYLTQVFC